jgi:hypothetical protein
MTRIAARACCAAFAMAVADALSFEIARLRLPDPTDHHDRLSPRLASRSGPLVGAPCGPQTAIGPVHSPCCRALFA